MAPFTMSKPAAISIVSYPSCVPPKSFHVPNLKTAIPAMHREKEYFSVQVSVDAVQVPTQTTRTVPKWS